MKHFPLKEPHTALLTFPVDCDLSAFFLGSLLVLHSETGTKGVGTIIEQKKIR